MGFNGQYNIPITARRVSTRKASVERELDDQGTFLTSVGGLASSREEVREKYKSTSLLSSRMPSTNISSQK